MLFDPRTTPARPDLAAESLRGRVEARRYSAGRSMLMAAGSAPLRHAPNDGALLDTEILFGELFTVYDEKGGWSWGQAAVDSYVGYVPSAALSPAPGPQPTHRVTALASHLYSAPDVRAPHRLALSLGARLRVSGTAERFAIVDMPDAPAFVPMQHIAPFAERAEDFVAVAERFLAAPYLWGGRTAQGLDCSALVQLSLAEAGQLFPRDSDQQQQVGMRLGTGALKDLRRGDLLFWKNHVAIAVGPSRLIHANGTAMAVTIDAVGDVIDRSAAGDGGALLDINRL
ncbi:MAG: NlpC/P60 family protein [Alphaproteobacteria bacterium]